MDASLKENKEEMKDNRKKEMQIVVRLTLQPLADAPEEGEAENRFKAGDTVQRRGGVAVVRVAGTDHLSATEAGTLIAIIGRCLVEEAAGAYHTVIWWHCGSNRQSGRESSVRLCHQ